MCRRYGVIEQSCVSFINMISQYKLFHLWTTRLRRRRFLSTPLISINKVRKPHHGNYSRFAYSIRANVGTPSCARGIEHDMQVYAGIVEAGHAVKEILA